jgi:hypothetical protein
MDAAFGADLNQQIDQRVNCISGSVAHGRPLNGLA